MPKAAVSSATLRKLEEAMDRLLTGRARKTNGALTKTNLYIEAGVSRATMNRATELLNRWDESVPRHENILEKRQIADETRRLEKKLKELRSTIRELQADLSGAATVITVLHTENLSLRSKLERLEKDRLAARKKATKLFP